MRGVEKVALFVRRIVGVHLLRLIRPLNGLLASVVVLTACHLSYCQAGKPLHLMIGAFFITSFINSTNDLFDLPEDSINHPDRPLPSGKVDEGQAWLLAIVSLFFALYFSYRHSYWALSVGSLAMFLGLLYNVHLKSVPLVGNLTVSTVIFLAFLYGSGGYFLYRVIPAGLLGAYLHLLREFVKSLQDMEGDAPYRRTVAHVLGEVPTRRVVFLGLILLPILSVLPVFVGYSTLYVLSVLLLVGFPTLVVSPTVLYGRYGFLSGFLKVMTATAVISLWMA